MTSPCLAFCNYLQQIFVWKTNHSGLLLFLIVFGASTAIASNMNYFSELRQLVQLAEYISVDYPAAVQDGEVINAGEHQEMIEFSGLILSKSVLLAGVPDGNRTVTDKAKSLQLAIISKQSVEMVQALAADLRGSLLTLAPQASVPDSLISNAESQALFQQSCAGCHGETGQGDGALAATLAPPPTNFTDRERAANRSVLGLYDAIANGIDGTGMAAFSQLTEKQKWSLAFYTGSLAFQSATASRQQTESVISLQQLINYSPNFLSKELPAEQRSQVEWLRANPQQLFITETNPISITRKQLEAAVIAYRAGAYSKAHDLAVSAYLDGFEQVEVSLSAKDKELKDELESFLISLRQIFSRSGNDQKLDTVLPATFQKLTQAESLLTQSSLSSGELFSASLVILLREGLEALLVVIALTTVLLRTNRKDALKYLHLGWVSALFAGGATWVAAHTLISISGTSREIMEGVGALLAAIVLFYVGFWMHNKSHAANWQAYIQRQIDSHLKTGTLWGIAALSFVAVYREIFETVLFYESLLTQADSSTYSSVIAGFAVAVGLLVAVAWAFIRYSVNLPISRFFASTTYLLLALAFVLMGKAICALQEAALIGISAFPINFKIEWLGIYSTWQGVLAQGLILILSIALTMAPKFRRKTY